jgi:hypothetical protein
MYPRKDKPIEWLLMSPLTRNVPGSILGLEDCSFFSQYVQARPALKQPSIFLVHKTL